MPRFLFFHPRLGTAHPQVLPRLLVVHVFLIWPQISSPSHLCVFYGSSPVSSLLLCPLITFRYQRLMKSVYCNINFRLCLLSVSEKCG